MSMHQMSVTLLTGLLMIAPLRCPPAWSWGSEGHQTIGAMADTLLAGTHAGQRVQALLLPGETLSTAAIWADCAKGFLYCHRALTPEMQTFVHRIDTYGQPSSVGLTRGCLRLRQFRGSTVPTLAGPRRVLPVYEAKRIAMPPGPGQLGPEIAHNCGI